MAEIMSGHCAGRAVSYASLAQLQTRYSERELRLISDPDAQAIDAARIAAALTDASDEIDTYLRARYVLPLVDSVRLLALAAPAALVRCCCDIAVYRLQTLRPGDDIKDARQRYDDVLKLLGRMASGDVALADAKLKAGVAGLPETLSSSGGAQFSEQAQPFSRANRH